MTEHTALPWRISKPFSILGRLVYCIRGGFSGNMKYSELIAELKSEADARLIVTACNCHAKLTEVADAANDLWALFSHNPDEIPYGDDYEQETMRLHQLLGEKLREYSAAIRNAEEQK